MIIIISHFLLLSTAAISTWFVSLVSTTLLGRARYALGFAMHFYSLKQTHIK